MKHIFPVTIPLSADRKQYGLQIDITLFTWNNVLGYKDSVDERADIFVAIITHNILFEQTVSLIASDYSQ